MQNWKALLDDMSEQEAVHDSYFFFEVLGSVFLVQLLSAVRELLP